MANLSDREIVAICIRHLQSTADLNQAAALIESELNQLSYPVQKNRQRVIDILKGCHAHLAKQGLALPPAPTTGLTIPPIASYSTTQLPQAAQAVAEPEEEVDFSAPHLSDNTLDEVGQALQAAFEQQGLALEFLSPAIRDHRYNRFFFRKPANVSYAKLEGSILRDILSHAGNNLDPTEKPLTRPRPNGCFELSILRPRSEWDIVPLLSSLPNWAAASPLLAQKTPDRYLRLLDRLHGTSPIAASSPLLLPFGVDMDGRPFEADLSTGFVMVGNPNTGKSSGLKTIINGFCLLLSPRLLRLFALWDLKDGVTLSRYKNLAWGNRIYTSSVADEIREVFTHLREEKQRRGRLLTLSDTEDIMQYNALTAQARGKAMEAIDPTDRQQIFKFNRMKRVDDFLPWQYSIVDEIIPMARVMGDEISALIGEMAREWRAAGLLLGVTTQYPRKDLGLDPSARVFGCTIVFATSESGAQLALGGDDASWLRMATQLPGFGSAIVKQEGRITPIQTYHTDPKSQTGLINQIFQPWSREYNAKNPSDFSVVDEVFSESNDPDWQKYQRVLEAIELAKQKRVQFSLTQAVDIVCGAGAAKKNWIGGSKEVERVLNRYAPELLEALKTKK